MHSLIVGVGEVSVRIRQAQSLKDKRNVLQGITQRLKNDGFSVIENANQDDPKMGTLGFSYVGRDVAQVEKLLHKAFDLFRMECEILEKQSEVFNYSTEDKEYLDPDEV